MKLEICHLYPDVLSGDQGNLLCMQKRLTWRGIEALVTRLPVGSSAQLSQFDLFFLGGGQDYKQEGLRAEIRAAIEDGKVFLAVDGGYELLGFIGALDIRTEDGAPRMTGDILFDTGEACAGLLVGFENHSGKTTLGPGVAPLGKALAGHGNNGEDGTEGCRYKNVFGTYAHGPLLPKNPKLADYILSTALSLKYPGVTLAGLDDELENTAHSYMVSRLGK